MSCITVTDQQQLDAALADAATTCVHVESERGVWLRVSSGSATVRAYGSATVEAYGSATVEAYGSATVEAYGSATVRAYGSATVEAYGTTSVHAHQRSTITAGSHVAVHLHSGQATVTGGVLIDITQLDLTNPAAWLNHHGVDIVWSDGPACHDCGGDGRSHDPDLADMFQDCQTCDGDKVYPARVGTAVLYKALGDDLTAGQEYGKPTVYRVGQTVTCDDWSDTNDCGGGLHFSPTPHMASQYHYDATRWLAVEVDVATLRPIDGGTPKAKAKSCRVLREVDSFGRLIEGEVTATVTITREG